jgi:hypothetical protein
LNLAMAVYPEARVDVEADGLALHPSAPAVPKAEACETACKSFQIPGVNSVQ